jgi:drug/metabolite transporter (DMT)-like permease
VLSVFIAVVLIGGTNFVAVRFSNRELAPFWGAGLRFAIGGALLVGFAPWRRTRLPLGSACPGAAVLGVVNFGVAYVGACVGTTASAGKSQRANLLSDASSPGST